MLLAYITLTMSESLIKKIEKIEITRALCECNWVKIRAAKRLGITERMIGYKIKKYGISKGGIKNTKENNQCTEENHECTCRQQPAG